MQNQKTKYNKSQNESLQNSESSPEFLEKKARPSGANSLSSYTPSSTSLRILLFCRFQMPGHPTGGGVARLHHAVVDGVGEDKRAGAPPLESKSRCKGELRLPGLVVGHLLLLRVLLPESSYWPHSDVCPLSEFIFRIHPCHRIKV